MRGDAEHQRAVKIATVALHRAMAGDLEDAASYIKRLDGTEGLITAIIGWCDTFIAQVIGDVEYGAQPVRMALWCAETGEVETADEAPVHARWAGRLISARLANDEAGFMALLKAPDEGAQLGDAIMGLLQSVAISIKNADTLRAAAAEIGGES